MLCATLQKLDAPSPPFRWLIYSWMHNRGYSTHAIIWISLSGGAMTMHVVDMLRVMQIWGVLRFRFQEFKKIHVYSITIDYQTQRSRLSSNASRPSFDQELSIGKKHCFSMISREKNLHNKVECYCQRWDQLGTAIFIQQSPSVTVTTGTKDWFCSLLWVTFAQRLNVDRTSLTVIASYAGARLWKMKLTVLKIDQLQPCPNIVGPGRHL